MTTALSWSLVPLEAARLSGEQAGVLPRDAGTLMLARASVPIREAVAVEGEVSCWHCRAQVAFDGSVFGRVGLGGVLRNARCPRCRGVSEVCAALLSDNESCGVYVFVPTSVRGRGESEKIRPVSLTLKKLTAIRPGDAPPDREHLRQLLSDMIQSVRPGADQQLLAEAAGKLVRTALTPVQAGRTACALRDWLRRETRLPVIAVLADALLCLRDPCAGPAVADAVKRGLQGIPHSSLDPALLVDLAALSLSCGSLSGYEAVSGLLPTDATMTTRARKLGRSLVVNELMELPDEGQLPSSCDSRLGGDPWRDAYAVLPSYPDQPQKRVDQVMGKLGRLLTQVTAPTTTPTPEIFFRGLARHFGDNPVAVYQLRLFNELTAQADLQLLASQASREESKHECVLLRGDVTTGDTTEPVILLVGPPGQANRLRLWLMRQLLALRYCVDRKVHVLGELASDGREWPITLKRIGEFRWVEL